jgi:hypothetical protein
VDRDASGDRAAGILDRAGPEKGIDRVGRGGHSVAEVARDFEVGWATVMAAVRDHGARLLQQAQLGAAATAIGVDQTAFTCASAHKPTVFATDVVDLRAVSSSTSSRAAAEKC